MRTGHSEYFTVYDCTVCSYNYRAMLEDAAKKHAVKPHAKCSCGSWYLKNGSHIGRNADHQEVEDMPSVDLASRQTNRWVYDPPPPPIPPVKRVPYVSYRTWRVFPQLPMLMPLVGDDRTPWLPDRERMEAVCNKYEHDAPANNCKCGFWGLSDLWDAVARSNPNAAGISFHGQQSELAAALDALGTGKTKHKRQPFLLAGAIEQYGLVLPGEDGWRSQYVRLLALWIVPNWTMEVGQEAWLHEQLGGMYNVPVLDDWRELTRMVDERRLMYQTAEVMEHLTAIEVTV